MRLEIKAEDRIKVTPKPWRAVAVQNTYRLWHIQVITECGKDIGDRSVKRRLVSERLIGCSCNTLIQPLQARRRRIE